MMQFLVEAVVMAGIGGAIGILLGIGSSEVLREWAQWPTLIDPAIVAIAFLFSGAVGVFFGFYGRPRAWIRSKRCAMSEL
jgi:putative ABC transport system permease protein